MAGIGHESSDDSGMITDINVTPLVDIMLCLLVIFMVTTTYVVADSIKVDLPQASTGDSTEPSTISLIYTRERELYLNGEPSSEAALRDLIRAELGADKELQAIIGADREVSHGEVVHLIDVIKQEGVVKFALNIDEQAAPVAACCSRSASTPPSRSAPAP